MFEETEIFTANYFIKEIVHDDDELANYGSPIRLQIWNTLKLDIALALKQNY